MSELLTYKEYLKDNKLEMWVYRKVLKSRINHTLNYIKKHLQNPEIKVFIEDYISDLQAQKRPLGQLPNLDTVSLLEDAIKVLKSDYLKKDKESDLFESEANERFFVHCLEYFNSERNLIKSDLVYFYHLFNYKFLNGQEKMYCGYVNKKYIKTNIVKSKLFRGKIPSITTIQRSLNALEKRNKLFRKAQENWNDNNKTVMRYNPIDIN